MTLLYTDQIPTPIGEVFIALEGHQLVFLDFADNLERIEKLLRRRYGTYALEPTHNPHGLSKRVSSYFDGDPTALEGIEVSTGGTAFQKQVWNGLLEIPRGQTWSYGQLAAHLKNPGAVRAVGQTNGLNPVALVLPCHRVVGANGTLTGYAGGLERKKWLLEFEHGSIGSRVDSSARGVPLF